MENLINKKQNIENGYIDEEIAERVGLAESGRDEENQKEYIGTQEQWNEYERIEREETLTEKLKQEHQENMFDDLEDEDEE